MAAFRFRRRQVRDDGCQENFEQLEGQLDLIGALTGVGQRISAAEYLLDSGSLAVNGESAVLTITHNLGVVPSVVIGHLEDGTWSHLCQWRVATRTTTQVTIRIFNHGPNVAQALLRCRLVY